ncbi:MAG TPA: hypothetical protein VFQ30_16965 [Ktedonobacteraceae bacterium]|nr:hypothetical protein [Ktedonobacteraceae bacterium]
MKTSKASYKHMPQLTIGLNDLYVIDSMLMAYLAYLRKGVASSPERDTRIRVALTLRQRFAALVAVSQEQGEMPILLTVQEFHTLEEAMDSFARLTRKLISPSAQRDETLQQVKAFRHMLTTLFSS